MNVQGAKESWDFRESRPITRIRLLNALPQDWVVFVRWSKIRPVMPLRRGGMFYSIPPSIAWDDRGSR